MDNTNSILVTVKDRLDIVDDTTFDNELITIINGVLAVLAQLGVGPKEGLEIDGYDTEWSSLIGTDKRLNFVKDYVCISTKLVFDYPTSSAYGKALEERKKEYEWRLNFEVDPYKMEV